MKKASIFLLALVMCLSLCGCNVSSQNEPAVIEVATVSLSKSKIELEPGSSVRLVANISPSNATDKNIIWQSSDPNVATVINGTVYAVADGIADIFATASNGVYATCSVVVVTPSAYSKLNSDEKEMFDAFVTNLSYFKNPQSIRFIEVKKHSFVAYPDYKYLATISASNSFGGTVSNNLGFGRNGIGNFSHNTSAFQSDSCFNIQRLNAALQEYLETIT